jgi:transposase
MKAYSVDLRQKVIDAHNQKDGTQRQLAKRFRVSLSFVQNLLKRYRIDGTVEPREHGGGQPAKLSLEQEAILVTLVEEDNDAIKARVVRPTGATGGCTLYSEQQWGALSKSLDSPEKKTLHATERDTERVQLLRVQYWHEIGEVKLENLVFIDETGTNLAMTLALCPLTKRQSSL